MPKNEQLITDIQVVANEKGVDVPVTEGKNNEELVAILKATKELPAAPPPPAPSANDKGDGGSKPKESDPDPDEKPTLPYSVAPGVSITCKGARILADGDEITKNDLPDVSFKAFIKSGHIKKG